jgi:hypothetical protein
MEKDKKSFRDRLIELADLSDTLENNELFKGGEIKISIVLNSEKYYDILSNFREIDRKNKKFFIDISDIKYEFILED